MLGGDISLEAHRSTLRDRRSLGARRGWCGYAASLSGSSWSQIKGAITQLINRFKSRLGGAAGGTAQQACASRPRTMLRDACLLLGSVWTDAFAAMCLHGKVPGPWGWHTCYSKAWLQQCQLPLQQSNMSP